MQIDAHPGSAPRALEEGVRQVLGINEPEVEA